MTYVFARTKLTAPWHKVYDQGDSLATTARCGLPARDWLYTKRELAPADVVCQNCGAL